MRNDEKYANNQIKLMLLA